MGSFFLTLLLPVIHTFTGWFEKEIPTLAADEKAELQTVTTACVTFAKGDIGKLAVDAVNMAAAKGLTGTAAFAAAKAQFIADAKTAGHDLTSIGSGIVDWMIQTAYTVIAGVVAQVPKS